jgi:hypothetical protein
MVNLLCSCLLAVALFGLHSCRKFLSIPPPHNDLTAASLFIDDGSATSAIYGLFSQLMNTNLFLTNGGASVFGALSSDELYNTAPSTSLDPFTQNALSPTDATTIGNRFWAKPYNFIYHANAILEGLGEAPGVSPGVRARLQGEARLVRALCYFYLVNFYGDVPLLLSTDYNTNKTHPRTTAAAVYEQVIRDLREAKELLPESYDGAGRTRPNKWTAAALLSRVYLYRGAWEAAEAEASAVISSGAYTLLSNLNEVFLAGSREALWQLVPVNSGFNTAEGNAFVPATATQKPTYALAPSLLNAFETGDARKVSWLKSTTTGGQTYHYPFKYKVRLSTQLTEHNTVVRLSEVYLIRAEARAQLQRLPEAREDLNRVRARASLPPATASSREALLLSIERERQVELFAEWGHRWLDLKRTGRINVVLGAVKPGWTPTAALYPLPLSELLVNPFLTQNPGY